MLVSGAFLAGADGWKDKGVGPFLSALCFKFKFKDAGPDFMNVFRVPFMVLECHECFLGSFPFEPCRPSEPS